MDKQKCDKFATLHTLTHKQLIKSAMFATINLLVL